MNIIGKSVSHKTFGSGSVTELTDQTVTVSFRGIEKRFIYPDAFKNFLTFGNPQFQENVEKQIHEIEAAAQKKRRIKHEENKRRQKLLSFKISPNSHLVVNIPPEQIAGVFQNLSFSTGTYLSGASRGLPRVMNRVKPNSVCLITSCPKGQDEHERKLVGAFMTAEDFFGDEAGGGSIKGHRKYHLILPEARRPLFWSQFEHAVPARWGNVPFKYCSAAAANRMLFEIKKLAGETDQGETAQEFYRYFCEINQLRLLREQEPKNKKKPILT